MLRAAHHIEAPARFQLLPGKTFAQSEGRIISSSAREQAIRRGRANALTQKTRRRGDGKRFVVRAEEKLTAFLELESALRLAMRVSRPFPP